MVYILQHLDIQQFHYCSSLSHSRVLVSKVTVQQPLIGAVSQLVHSLSLDCGCSNEVQRLILRGLSLYVSCIA